MFNEASPRTWTHTAKFLGAPLVAFALLLANAYFPFVRFSNELANAVLAIVIFFLPFLTAILAFTIPRRWLTTITVFVLLVPLLCFSAVGLLWEGFLLVETVRTGVNPAYEQIATAQMAGYSVGIYRTDCGALCSFGIDPLQEKQVVLGILVVRELPGFEDAGEATYKVIGQDTLLIRVPAYVDNDPPVRTMPARSRIYHLKRFLYF
jgi:hypothetical protein